MLDVYKQRFKKLETLVGKIFSFFPITPNHWTFLSIVFALGSFYFLLKENLILATISFLIAGFLDFVDGAVARSKNLASPKGAYFDTIVDRYVEGILLFGILFLPLPQIIFPYYFWVFLIFFGSLMTTYAKCAAKEKDLVKEELKGGFLSRTERIILLLISLVLGIFNYSWMTYLLILIAILTNFTAFQRIYSALKI